MHVLRKADVMCSGKSGRTFRSGKLLRYGIVCVAMTLFAAPAMAATRGCHGPQYHQLDFWLGNWKVYDNDGKGPYVASDKVSRMLEGCIVIERYRASDGHGGDGVFAYDASRKLWHQTWVTNSGSLLIIEGPFKGGVLTMLGSNLDAHGVRVWCRAIWKAESGGVRQTAFTSKDGGKSWQPAWDILFVKGGLGGH